MRRYLSSNSKKGLSQPCLPRDVCHRLTCLSLFSTRLLSTGVSYGGLCGAGSSACQDRVRNFLHIVSWVMAQHEINTAINIWFWFSSTIHAKKKSAYQWRFHVKCIITSWRCGARYFPAQILQLNSVTDIKVLVAFHFTLYQKLFSFFKWPIGV